MSFRTSPVNHALPELLAPGQGIDRDIDSLAGIVCDMAAPMSTPLRVTVDGMWGVPWKRISDEFARVFEQHHVGLQFLHTTAAMLPPDQVADHFQPWLTENPVFGRVCNQPLSDYFNPDAWEALLVSWQAAIGGDKGEASVALLIGPGAALAPADLRIYIDMPRDEIVRAQQDGLGNMGFPGGSSSSAVYKVAYYVEWPLTEAHREAVLPQTDYYVSFSGGEFTYMRWDHLELLMQDVASRPLRCRPFFMPGVWGGQRLKNLAGLPREWPNCAWDFEVVAPENAVILGYGNETITVPFPLMMSRQGKRIIGSLASEYFGTFFPIRFNYLDTVQGTNLSCQVHPHAGYIRTHFNEPIAQDETYYIVETKPGAKVYLGLCEDAAQEAFRSAVHKAEEEAVPFDITDFVNEWDAQKGDLFWIPAGTVHCSGADNLVLEISATPYWYTFKIYDYLRPDMTGKPRPINSAHAFEVIDFGRRTEWVQTHLLAQPTMLRQDAGGAEYRLGGTPFTFFGINRLEIKTEMTDDTAGAFHLLNVVSGEAVEVVSDLNPKMRFGINYLETFIVPAVFGPYRIIAQEGPCQVVKAYVKC